MQTATTNFITWCQSQLNFKPIKLNPKVDLKWLGNCQQTGMVCLNDMKPNEIIAKIPKQRIMKSFYDGNYFFKDRKWAALALTIMEEREKKQYSKWDMYLNSFPSDSCPLHPIFFPTSFMNLALMGTPVYEKLQLDRMKIKDDWYKGVLPFLKKKYGEEVDLEDKKYQFLKAIAFIMSYSFTLDDNSTAMIPIADALNHHPNNNACLKYVSKYPDSILIVSTKNIAKNEQIYNTFGQLDIHQTLEMYGFAFDYLQLRKTKSYNIILKSNLIIEAALDIGLSIDSFWENSFQKNEEIQEFIISNVGCSIELINYIQKLFNTVDIWRNKFTGNSIIEWKTVKFLLKDCALELILLTVYNYMTKLPRSLYEERINYQYIKTLNINDCYSNIILYTHSICELLWSIIEIVRFDDCDDKNNNRFYNSPPATMKSNFPIFDDDNVNDFNDDDNDDDDDDDDFVLEDDEYFFSNVKNNIRLLEVEKNSISSSSSSSSSSVESLLNFEKFQLNAFNWAIEKYGEIGWCRLLSNCGELIGGDECGRLEVENKRVKMSYDT